MTDTKTSSDKGQVAKRIKPSFKRTDSWRKKGLKDTWRKPRGRHNKLRLGKFNKGPLVRVGYGNSKLDFGKNADSKYEVLVHNVSDVEKLNKAEDVVLISKSTGLKKKYQIVEKAKELGIGVVNTPTRVKKIGAKKQKALEEKVKKEKAKKTEAKKPETKVVKAEEKTTVVKKPVKKEEKPKTEAKKPKAVEKVVKKPEKKVVKK
ncbi:MAG: 50S ribosomal protein L32e [Candidatus Aenigmarchaeota archaeon]|nr:50S ribosomal protein L32e [Candidatus Aenigmarchaeota archaeon]